MSSTGYTPVFSSIYDGTLYGKWPAAAVFASLLPLCDPQGRIDMSVQAIAGRTGWPIELLEKGIEQLSQPDPHSRSKTDDGRRLALLDPAQPWGWRVINHALYREKARLMAKNAREVESGKNKLRMATREESSDEDRRRPPETPADPLSNTDSDSDSGGNLKSQGRGAGEGMPRGKRAAERGTKCPEKFLLTPEMRAWAAKEAPLVDLVQSTREFVDYWRAIPGQRGRKLDWVATWRNRMRECQARLALRAKPAPVRRSEAETIWPRVHEAIRAGTWSDDIPPHHPARTVVGEMGGLRALGERDSKSAPFTRKEFIDGYNRLAVTS